MKVFAILSFIIAFAIHIFAEPTVRYSGMVRDPSGAPAVGVQVSFYSMFYSATNDYAEAKTDIDGRYEIIQPKKIVTGLMTIQTNLLINSIIVRDFGRNLAAVKFFDQTTIDNDLNLQPAITLCGSVKNTEGAAVRGASMDIQFLSGGALPRLLNQSIVANELGQFSIPALPRDCEYFIWGVTAKGYGSGSFKVKGKRNYEPQSRESRWDFGNFVLKHANHKLAGQVLNSEGKPAIGANIGFGGSGQPFGLATTSDGEGKFIFDAVCEGEVRLWASWNSHPTIVNYPPETGGVEFIQAGDTNATIKLRSPFR